MCVNVMYKYDIILYQGLEHLQNLEFCSSQDDLICSLVLCVNFTSPCSKPCIVTVPFMKTWDCGPRFTWMIHTGMHEKSRSSNRMHDMTLIGSNIHVTEVWGREEKGWPGAVVSWWGDIIVLLHTGVTVGSDVLIYGLYVLDVFSIEK